VVTESYHEAFQREHQIKGGAVPKKKLLFAVILMEFMILQKSERKQREQIKKKTRRAERNEVKTKRE
jgi:hypothetical protein